MLYHFHEQAFRAVPQDMNLLVPQKLNFLVNPCSYSAGSVKDVEKKH